MWSLLVTLKVDGHVRNVVTGGITVLKHPMLRGKASIDDEDYRNMGIDKIINNIPYVAKSIHIILKDKTRQMPIYHYSILII